MPTYAFTVLRWVILLNVLSSFASVVNANCGNGIVEQGESCDDGNNINSDGCESNCVITPTWRCVIIDVRSYCHRCGDGLIQSPLENCDDSNSQSNDGCSSLCLLEVGWVCKPKAGPCKSLCGDGWVVGSEVCDDGNSLDGDGCDSTCKSEPGWNCYLIPFILNGTTVYTSQCSSICGDGIVTSVEHCDRGPNGNDGSNGCNNCTVELGWVCSDDNSTLCAPTCGNGVLDEYEKCDDNNLEDKDGCRYYCKVERGWKCVSSPSDCTPVCGDGIIIVGEECDDNNEINGDGCSSNCLKELGYNCTGEPSICFLCGNGIKEGFEECDDGNLDSSDGCSTSCTVEDGFTCYANVTCEEGTGYFCYFNSSETSICFPCGNGEEVGIKECDDGNQVDGDGCSRYCVIEPGYACNPTCATFCGDAIVAGEEECDPGSAVVSGCSSCKVVDGWICPEPDQCTTVCGNFFRTAQEVCDDGNLISGDGCSSVCEKEDGWDCFGNPSICNTLCGDGLRIGPEECDTGQGALGSRFGCSFSCRVERGWDCFEPTPVSPSICNSICGDGIVTLAETCDDNNTISGDGCNSTCGREPGFTCSGEPSICTPVCGDGIKAYTEECDDGNNIANDGCSSICRIEPGYNCTVEPNVRSVCNPICGDGIIRSPESCDDGNLINGDGCSSNCTAEPGFSCSRQPSVCVCNACQPQENINENESDNLAVIIISIGGGIIGLIAIVALFVFIMIKRKSKRTSNQIEMQQRGSIDPKLQLKVNVIPTSEIQIGQLLGTGQFGQVLKGNWNGTAVALKMLKEANQREGLPEELLAELSILKNLNHPNIIRLFGTYVDANENEYIVMEFASKGSLLELLRREGGSMSLKDMLKICVEIVTGMRHLEKNNILHRDLAARNVLISQVEGRYSAKISDFGLSRQADEGYYTTKKKELPVKWTAPEVLDYSVHSAASDVFSFGIVMWEIFSCGVVPYTGMTNLQTMDYVRSGKRLACPEKGEAIPGLYELMLRCWDAEPENRITFSQLYDELNSLLSSLQ